MLTQPYDDTAPLPDGADTELRSDSPRLTELTRRLRSHPASGDRAVSVERREAGQPARTALLPRREPLRLALPRVARARWRSSTSSSPNTYTPHDSDKLLDRLGDDGAFGCWTFDYAGYPKLSRDLLDSVNELLFLDRHVGILDRPQLRVLDIGAGYGRTAYRMAQAAQHLDDYCCVDAIPESTFLSEYYLRHRGCVPPARVVPLHEIDRVGKAGDFDLAVNIHSFSECTYEAVSWWFDWLEGLRIPNLLIVPNDREELPRTSVTTRARLPTARREGRLPPRRAGAGVRRPRGARPAAGARPVPALPARHVTRCQPGTSRAGRPELRRSLRGNARLAVPEQS